MDLPGSPRGLLFDIGGVVIGIDFERALESWQQWSGLTIDEMRDRFRMDEAYDAHERGRLPSAQYIAHLRDALDLDADDPAIIAGWNRILVDEIGETLDCIDRARATLPCFALSNTNPIHMAHWTPNYDRMLNSFDRIFVSCDLGLRKPEPAAFEAIADATGIGFDELVFFDDTEQIVEQARALGIPSVLVRSHDDVRLALERVGVVGSVTGY